MKKAWPEQIIDQDNLIRRAALDLLARRDHSKQELSEKLINKNYPPDRIDTVLMHLANLDLINDQRFTENYIHGRRRKGYGPERIAMELSARGIKPGMIAEQLKITDNEWYVEAHHVWQKHFKGQEAQDFKGRVKQMRFLQYRGFTREQIESVLKSISQP